MPTGNLTTVTGEINISPPLTWKEFRAITPAPPNTFNYPVVTDALLRIAESSEDTDEGCVIYRSGDAIVPADNGARNHYYLAERVQSIIDSLPEDRIFSGYLEVTGDTLDDLWRIYITQRTAVVVGPQVVWEAP